MRRKNRKGSVIQREAVSELTARKLVADEAEMRARIAPEPRSLTAAPIKNSPKTPKALASLKHSRKLG
jgi:hypothetical protein